MFTKKAIGVTIALAEGVFEGSNNEITLPEVPTHVSCDKTGGDELPKCTIEVKNLKLDLMQRLTVLAFRKLQTYNNVIKVMAGDYGGKLDLVFQGEIVSAVPDFGTDGSVTFKIEAMTGFYPLQLSTAPVSVQGYTTIESLMAQFAKEAGYAYENSGVSGSVKNSVYRGSPIQKARQLARQTGIDLLIQDGKFITLPDYDTSRENVVPYFTKDSGLLGYPSFTSDASNEPCKTFTDKSWCSRISAMTGDGAVLRFSSVIGGAMERNALDFVFVASEAAELWGRHGQTVRYACDCIKHPQYRGFTNSECRKSGGAWLVTAAGMVRLFGAPRMMEETKLVKIRVSEIEQRRALQKVYTLQEAAEKWNVEPRWRVKNAMGGYRRKKLFEDDEVKKSGNHWLVTEDAMVRVFGEKPSSINEDNQN